MPQADEEMNLCKAVKGLDLKVTFPHSTAIRNSSSSHTFPTRQVTFQNEALSEMRQLLKEALRREGKVFPGMGPAVASA
eukprot:3122967-Prymnesium_polylepis.1